MRSGTLCSVVVVHVSLNTGRCTTDGVNSFVRRTRKSELVGRNQSPVGALGRNTQGLVAPSGCNLGSGIDARAFRKGRVKQAGPQRPKLFQAALIPAFTPTLRFWKLVE